MSTTTLSEVVNSSLLTVMAGGERLVLTREMVFARLKRAKCALMFKLCEISTFYIYG